MPSASASKATRDHIRGGRIDQVLVPRQQLHPVKGAASGTWRSLGNDPQFVTPCRLPAGWVRIRLRLASVVSGRMEILFDTGKGFDNADCVERATIRGTVARDFFVRLPRAARGIRLDPLDCEGDFRLTRFEVIPVPAPVALAQALWTKLTLLFRYHRTGRALWNGLRLLARGQWGRIGRKIHEALKGPSPLAPPLQDPQRAYEEWRRNRQLRPRDRARLRSQAAAIVSAPTFSVLLPVAAGDGTYLPHTLDSVLKQIYPHWQLCIATLGTLSPELRALLEQFAERDPRICCVFRPEDQGGAAALNLALSQARGDYVTLLEPADELAEQALLGVAHAVAAGQPDMVYADEDRIDGAGRHHTPFFKPGWSPEYMLSWVYTGRPAVYRTALVRQLGGFRQELEGAAADDLALRVAAHTERIHHIPDVLCHRRTQPSAAESGNGRTPDAGRRALAHFLQATGRAGSVAAGPFPGLHQVRLAIAGRPKVSIIIPTAYRQGISAGKTIPYLARCVATIQERSTYAHYEIMVLDNGAPPPDMADALTRWGIFRAAYAQPFNWSRTMNQGAARAAGEHLVFLDDDTEVISPDWLEGLLEYSQQAGVGAVGARLEFPDGRLQHAGVTILDGVPGHPFYGAPGNHLGYFFSNVVPRNYSAVTSACLMTRAQVFRDVGGFSEEFACNFNDIDYCLRVGSHGLRVACNPYCRLVHHESATKSEFLAAELCVFRARWGSKWQRDPYHNPNLSHRFNDFRVEPDGEPACGGLG